MSNKFNVTVVVSDAMVLHYDMLAVDMNDARLDAEESYPHAQCIVVETQQSNIGDTL
jgi:hypothetical protein